MTKKFIAKFLAAMIFVGHVLPSIGLFAPVIVLANTDITVNATVGLEPGGAADLAPNNITAAPTDQIYVSFPVAANTQYDFSFWMPMAGGGFQRVTLDIRRDGNTLDFYYHLENYISGTLVPVTGDFSVWSNSGVADFLSSATFLVNHGGLEIFYNDRPSGIMEPGFVPVFPGDPGYPGDYLADGTYVGPGMGTHIPDLVPGPAIPGNYTGAMRADMGVIRENPSGDVEVPAFRIQGLSGYNGNGFSFMFGGRTMHVRFDGTHFHFATDGFDPGFIFEFVLYNHLTSDITNMPVSSGVAIDNVNIIPFANDNRTITNENFTTDDLDELNAAIPATWSQLINDPIDRRFNNVTGGPAPALPPGINDEYDEVWPGEVETGLILQVPLPIFTDQFRGTDRTLQNAAGAHMPVNLLFTSPGIDQMAITNIFVSPSSVNADVAPMGDDYIIIRMADLLEPSSLLPTSNLTFATTAPPAQMVMINRNSVINDIHTFLEFDVVRTAVGYAVRVTNPYSIGEYRLLSYEFVPGAFAPGDGSGMQNEGVAPDTAHIPWTTATTFAVTNPHAYRFYYLQFRSSSTGRIIESQRLVFTADPEAVYIGIPLYFDATAVHERMPGNMDATQGILSLGITWDMGSVSDIVRLFNNEAVNVGGVYEFTIDYDLVWDFTWNQVLSDIPDGTGTVATIRSILRAFNDDGSPATLPLALTPAALAYYNFEIEHFLVLDDTTFALGHERPELIVAGRHYPRLNIHEEFVGPRQERNPDGSIDTVIRRGFTGISGQRFAGSLTLEIDTFQAGELVVGPHIRPFQFPYVYFLRIMPVRATADGVPTDLVGDFPSEFSSITIGGFTGMQVPPPQNLQLGNQITLNRYVGQDIDQVSFDVSFNLSAEAVRNFIYNSHGLEIADRVNDINLEVSMYIAQSEEALLSLLEAGEGEWNGPNNQLTADTVTGLGQFPRHTLPGMVVHEFDGYLGNLEYTLFFSDIYGLVQNTGISSGSGDLRDALRNGNIVAITGISLTEIQWAESFITPGAIFEHPVVITLDGLDENETYYIMLDAIITQEGTFLYEDESGVVTNQNIAIRNASVFTNLSGIVSDGVIRVPDPAEQYPPAPDLEIPNWGMDYAVLEWNRIPRSIALNPEYTEVLDYEIIRVRAPQPENSLFMNRRDLISYIWPDLYPEHGPMTEGITAFRTINSHSPDDRQIERWDGTSWVAGPANITFNNDYTTYNLSTGEGVVSIRDNDLQANTVYFYYIRTVRRIFNSDGELVRELNSIFNNATVTTTIADAPIDLIIELDGGPNLIEFDRLSEIFISFVAPIGNLTNLAPDNIRLQYQIQIDDGSWGEPRWMRESFLLQADNHEPRTVQVDGEDEQWHWFLYHVVGGIEPNELHNIRVRTVQILPTGNSYSMWSNIATWLSDPDRTLAEFDRITRDWLNHAREQVYRLLRSPYWFMRRDNTAQALVFRPSLFNEVLRGAVGNHIVLPFDLATQTVYYVPAQSFLEAVASEATWVIPSDRMRIMVPNGTIDMANNPAVLTMAAAIRDRSDSIEDYFVRLNVNWAIVPQVHGQQTITQSADVSFELVAADQNLSEWEQDTLQQLENWVDELFEIGRYVELIEDGVRGYADNFQLQRYVLDMIETAQENFIEMVRSEFTDVQTNRSRLPVNFDRSIMLNATAGDGMSAVEAYTFIGGIWARIATTFDNGAGALVASSAPVVFTGRLVNIPGLQGAVNSGQTIGIVARHGLDDFFGTGYIDTAALSTRGQLIDSVARMLGAPRGTTNSNNWLRDRGINIPPGALTTPLTKQEALHMLMSVYTNQTGTTAESIRITNFNATSNVDGLSPSFATTFRAAIELGLYTNTNLQPAGPITIGTLLDVLTNLDSLIGL